MMWQLPHLSLDKPIDWDIIEHAYDWFAKLKHTPQDKIWHAEGNVQIHTKMVVDALLQLDEFQLLSLQDQYILVTAALCHDIEKIHTTKTELIDGSFRVISPNHAKNGEQRVREFLWKEIPTSFHIREAIAKLVRYHGLPLWAIEKDQSEKHVIRASLEVNTKHLAILAKADILGRICENEYKEYCLSKIALFEILCQDYDCFGKAYEFPSDLARFTYLNKDNAVLDYIPFDDCRFDVFMVSALPGTGKDYYISNNFDLPVVSLDNIRRDHKLDPKNVKHTSQAVLLAKEQAKTYLRRQQSFVFNATNIKKDLRGKWLSLFQRYYSRTHLIYLEADYETVLSQNKSRSHPVPEYVINDLIYKLDMPSYSEAHKLSYIIKYK